MADPSSLSNPHEAVITHVDWNARINFETQIISARAIYSVEIVCSHQDKPQCVKFDTAHLLIKSCTVDGLLISSHSLSAVDERKAYLGSCLTILLPSRSAPKSVVRVSIDYETTDKCTAAQWLPPSQTAGKVHPYLFTQCQAIHARSLIPCQDCPGVKFTYSACISTPMWATCVMSALSKSTSINDDSTKSYHFEQPVPISSYLLALAVGDLASSEISPRCRIWTEPSVLSAAAYEFSNTETFLQTAESLTGLPYPWGRYDILCLPPSFPYGGMENPCLTFVTPTLLAGDRSLVDVIAHEISHSWTGNLVTNRTWDHFWLNEGWTTWLQRKIMSRMPVNQKHLPYGFVDFDALGGWKALQSSVDGLPERYTRLIPHLGDDDPDAAFSRVPYEKGFHLLYALERIVGEEPFLIFAGAYLKRFQSLTVTSQEFRAFAVDHFHSDNRVADFDWDGRFTQPGMPPEPQFDRSLADRAEGLAKKWISFDSDGGEVPATDTTDWPCNLVCCFLDTLIGRGTPLRLETVSTMKEAYGFQNTMNSEILLRFCQIALDAGDKTILPIVTRFITTQGRMKYVRPLYRKLFHSKFGKDLAISTFLLNKDFYHPIAAKMLATDLSLLKEEEERKTSPSLLPSRVVWRSAAIAAGLALLSLVVSRKKK